MFTLQSDLDVISSFIIYTPGQSRVLLFKIFIMAVMRAICYLNVQYCANSQATIRFDIFSMLSQPYKYFLLSLFIRIQLENIENMCTLLRKTKMYEKTVSVG